MKPLSSSVEHPITNYRGDILSNFEDYINYYDAYGNERRDTVGDNPFGYCGEYTDAESGLIYLRNRYYDPTVGRFINEDPIKDGINWYAYCGGNPVRYVDPWGLAEDEDKAIMSSEDLTKIRILTYAYNITDNVEEKEAYRRAAVRIRQKDEYKWKYSNVDSNGIYNDTYDYTSKSSLYADVTIMSEGMAWLEGGKNKKNDYLMELSGVIPVAVLDCIDVMSGLLELTKSEYDTAKEILKEGDVLVTFGGIDASGDTVSSEFYYRIVRSGIRKLLGQKKVNRNTVNTYINQAYQK